MVTKPSKRNSLVLCISTGYVVMLQLSGLPLPSGQPSTAGRVIKCEREYTTEDPGDIAQNVCPLRLEYEIYVARAMMLTEIQ